MRVTQNRPVDLVVVVAIVGLMGLMAFGGGIGLFLSDSRPNFAGVWVVGFRVADVTEAAIVQSVLGSLDVLAAYFLWRRLWLGWWILLLSCINGVVCNIVAIHASLFFEGFVGILMSVAFVVWLFVRKDVFSNVVRS